MHILSGVFRRKSLPSEPSTKNIFSVALAEKHIQGQLGMSPTGKAGICFKPTESSAFSNLEQEIQAYITLGEKDSGTRYAVKADSYGSRWIILADDQFDDLVTETYMVIQAFSEHGFERCLLAAIFPFHRDGQAVYWIYICKRGTFYPFAPLSETRQRDSSLELTLSALIGEQLPVEQELANWYPLWDVPFDII